MRCLNCGGHDFERQRSFRRSRRGRVLWTFTYGTEFICRNCRFLMTFSE